MLLSRNFSAKHNYERYLLKIHRLLGSFQQVLKISEMIMPIFNKRGVLTLFVEGVHKLRWQDEVGRWYWKCRLYAYFPS